MNLRAFIAFLTVIYSLPLCAEISGYGFDYSPDDIPNSSIYQMLYLPNVKQDVPYTSIYSEIYDEGLDGDLDKDEDTKAIEASLRNLGNLNEFETSVASDFSIQKDFFGTARWTGTPERRTERALRCPRGYISERLNAETLTIERSCSGFEGGEIDTVGGNAFLANSTDKTLQQFGDANSFVAAMTADSRRAERLKAAMMNSGNSAQAAKLGLIFSDDMVALLERFAATSPGLREVLDEAIATGDIKVIYRRIQEAGGLESLMSQSSNGQMQQNYDMESDY